MLWLVAILMGLVVIYVIQNYLANRRFVNLIDKLPGPRAFPFVGTAWSLLGIPIEDMFMHISNQGDKYYPGPYRSWLGNTATVNIAHAEHIEGIVNNQKHIAKGITYDFLHPWLGDGLLTSKGEKWFRHRRLITPAFHFKILDLFTDIFIEKCDIMLKRLEPQANGKPFDIYPYITRCTLDIISDTAMGVEINAQTDQDSEYITAIYGVSELTMKRAVLPWLQPNIIWNNIADGKQHKKLLTILHNFTYQVMKDRRVARKKDGVNIDLSTKIEEDIYGKKKRLAFLDVLLEAAENDPNLTDTSIREEVDTFMFEGHDTTTAAICWALLLLGNEPEYQKLVHDELDTIFEDPKRCTTKQDLINMKYLEMVIKETLRLYPSVPIIGRVLKEDHMIGKYLIPKNAAVYINIMKAQRDPAHWENPNKFNPDNFLKENSAKRHPYAYLPFSAGPRNCIGQKFALLEEKTVLSAILRKYRVIATEKIQDVKVVGSLILRPLNGVTLVLEKRQ